MKIIISGATGVIGRRVVPLLMNDGHRVTALVRPGCRRRSLLPRGCAVVEGSLFDRARLTVAVAGHEVVVNLATHIPKSSLGLMLRAAWRENNRIRSEGARKLAVAAADGGARTLIQESFGYAYPGLGMLWIDEEQALRPAAHCRGVLDAEAAARAFGGRGGRGIILRFAAFYGADADQTRTMVQGVRHGWAMLPGDPAGFISSVSHEDAATAVVAALKAPSGAYNVADDCPVSHAEFCAVLAATLDQPEPRFFPAWTAALMGSAGRTLARSIRLRNDKLRRLTGWRPLFPSVREGLPGALKPANRAAQSARG